MIFKNLTPHAVTLANGEIRITIEKKPEDPIVRVEHSIVRATMEYELSPGVKVSLPVEAHQGYQVMGLPDPQPGVLYIVSNMVASRVRRADVVSPLTDATCERDETGRVISVRGFQTYANGYGEITKTYSETEGKVEEVFEVIGESEPEPIEIFMDEPKEMAVVFVDEAPVEIQKVDPIMLDPIKLAAKMKYEKRVAKYKQRQGR